MARRKPQVYELDWSSFDKDYGYAHKQANEDLLASGDNYWLEIFEAQPEEIREKIAKGQVSLQQLEDQRKAVSDEGFTPSTPVSRANVVDTLVENPELSPEEAGIVAEAEPIDSRLEALGTHFTSSRGIASADADFEDLDSLRQYETPESRASARASAEAILKDPAYLDRGMSGFRNEARKLLERVEEAEKLFTTPGEYDRRLQEIGSKRILSGRDQGRVERYYQDTGNVGTRTVGDVISQPESALPIIGGIVGSAIGPGGTTIGAMAGAAPMAKRAYDAAYTEARLAGVDQATAKGFATAMMGSEFVLESLGGKVAGGLSGVLKDELKKYIPELAGKTATKMGVAGALGAGVGYAEEAGTEVLQNAGALFGAELADNPEFKKFLTGQIPRAKDGSIDVGATLAAWNRSGLAGAGQGGPITAAGAGINNLVEQSRKEQQAVLANTVGNEAAKARYSALIDAATKRAEELGRVADGQLKQKQSTQTNPLDVIASQYTEAGGKLTDGTAMPTITSVLTPEQRAGELKKKIEGMGTIPTTPKAPVKPRMRGSKPVTPAGKSTVPLTAKPAPTAKQEPSEAPTQAELLKKIEGLKSERAPDKLVTPGTKSKNVIGHLSRLGTSDSDSILELINKGKLGIVDREADLPDGLEKGRDGWYDPAAKRVYLVAENLSKDTVRGTALHEINHFLNRNKKDGKTSTGINKLISGNVDTYNNRITNLAKSGNKIAQRALTRAQEDGNVAEELTSYFASEALDVIQKQGILGTARQVYKDIKSAINTTARDKGIGELTDNDISYILRRQVEDAPNVDFTDGDKGLADGRASIIGSKSPKFAETANKYPERVYRGARDNKPRVEISDRKAEIVNLPWAQRLVARGETEFTLEDIFKHDELYAAYDRPMDRSEPASHKHVPLKKMVVMVDPDMKTGEGSYSSKEDVLFVSPEDLGKPDTLKGIILHELQHAIQSREDFERGSSLAVATDEIRGKNPNIGDKELGTEAWRKYQRAYGEAEARLSEDNFRLTDEELSDTLPEERMTELEWSDKNNRIERNRLHPLQTGPGHRLVQRAEKRMPLDLPQGLASIKSSKGGEFAPAFVMRILPDALVNKDLQPDPVTAKLAEDYHRIVKNYLSRWAGTEQDPLKNITLPQFDDATWEDTWDLALMPAKKKQIVDSFKSRYASWLAKKPNLREPHPVPRPTARALQGYQAISNEKIPDDAVIWGGRWQTQIKSTPELDKAVASISDFLEHTLDFVMANRLEEGLERYDMQRLVRETLAWDEAAKKKAEKQKAIADTKLKTYIQFPDGYKWVRLDSPGQFAAESDMMGHSVRGYEPAKQEPLSVAQWMTQSQNRYTAINTPALRQLDNEYNDLYLERPKLRKKMVEAQDKFDAANEKRRHILDDYLTELNKSHGTSISMSDIFRRQRASSVEEGVRVSVQMKDNELFKSLGMQDGELTIEKISMELTELDHELAHINKKINHLVAMGETYKAYLENFNYNVPEGTGEGGHDHYGYGGWEAIKKDHARIYSLRDPKGKSVVTVELGKDTEDISDAQEQWLAAADEQMLADNPEAIPAKKSKFEVSQIKGRYNEAPDPSLHPKIQDLLLNLNEENLIDPIAGHGDFFNAGIRLVDLEDLNGRIPNNRYLWVPNTQEVEQWLQDAEDYVGSKANNALEALERLDVLNKPPTTKRQSGGLASKSNLAKSDVSAWDDTGMSIIKLLFDPNKGIGKQGLETRDYWRLKSAGYRDLAEGVQVRLNHQIKKLGINYDEFTKAVRKAEKQKTPEERERALDGLVRSYGEAGVEYREGRMLIDNLSKQILKDWYNESQKTGRKANQEEINRYQTILDNLGEYSTRIYLSDIPHVGKDYAKGVLRQFDKGDESSPYYNIVKEAREFLLSHEVGIPTFDEMVRRKTETIRRTYQTWVGKGDNLKKMDMIYALEQKRNEVTPEEMDKMVSKVIREMLGLDNPNQVSPVAKYYRAGALDEGILKARQKVPRQLRRLLGEVTDPGQRILTTVSAQADLLFKNRMLNDFYDNGEGKYWIKPGDRAKEGNEKFTEALPSTGYGPLDGVYVTKPFAYAIKAQRTQITDLKQSLELAGVDPAAPLRWGGEAAVKLIGGLSMAQKMSKTALDQGAWALNAAGSPLALLKNGQVLGASKGSRQALVDALTLAVQAMGVEHKLNKETNARLAVLLEHGIPDSVFTAELRDTEKEFYQKLLNDLNPDVVDDPREFINILKKSGRGGKRALRGIRDIYGLLDSWVKIADFYGQQEYFESYHKANGDNLSQEDINRKAADMVKFRNITYSRSPLAVQVAEKAGATVFATFASEVLRTMVTTPYTVKMNLEMAKNAKTPEARNIALGEATKVGLGYLTALAIIPAFTHLAINSMWPEDDEEDRERFLKLWFPQDRDQSFVVAGKNEDGGVVMFNAARADPHGHVTDFIRQVAQGDSPEEFWDNVKALFTSPMGNGYMADLKGFIEGQGPKDSALADMVPGAQKELGDLFENVDGSRSDADRLTRVLDNFLPGGARVFDPSKTKVTGTSQDAMVTNALAHAGMRMTVIDPKKIAGFEAMAYNNARADAAMKWNELMHTENLEKEDIVRTALNIYEKEQEAQRRLNEVYSGLGSDLAGVNPRKLLTELKVNPEDINDAALGRYRSVVLSGPRLREQENRQLGQAKTAEDKKKLRENYRLARETLRELQLLTR